MSCHILAYKRSKNKYKKIVFKTYYVCTVLYVMYYM